MNSKKHAKKRNASLLYEFVIRKVSSDLIEGKQLDSAKALKLLRKSFKPGSQLHTEFRIANALLRTTVSSEQVAVNILAEAKKAVVKQDAAKLDREKSMFIRNVNHNLNDPMFFDRQVNDYRMHAVVQRLFNEWRSTQPDLKLLATHEDELVRWLTTEKVIVAEPELSENTPGQGRLLLRTMMNKLNEKYTGVLTNEQKSLIRDHVWSTSNDDPERITNRLESVKSTLLKSLDVHISENSLNEHVVKQMLELKQRLLEETSDVTDDAKVMRFLQYVQLNDEFAKRDETV